MKYKCKKCGGDTFQYHKYSRQLWLHVYDIDKKGQLSNLRLREPQDSILEKSFVVCKECNENVDRDDWKLLKFKE